MQRKNYIKNTHKTLNSSYNKERNLNHWITYKINLSNIIFRQQWKIAFILLKLLFYFLAFCWLVPSFIFIHIIQFNSITILQWLPKYFHSKTNSLGRFSRNKSQVHSYTVLPCHSVHLNFPPQMLEKTSSSSPDRVELCCSTQQSFR